jgi:predicted nuclease of predicted toxin-antitoxin system
MKLLLDQNLSRKLVRQIEEAFPDSCHLTAVLPEASTDKDIWLYAEANDFVIVTKDDDFEQRSVLLGHPPKVIWIRLGNCRTADVVSLLLNSEKIIHAFGDDQEKSILPIP